MDTDIQQGEDLVKQMNFTPLLSYKVENSAPNRMAENNILVLTPARFCLIYSQRSEIHLWKNISHLSFEDDEKISISFNDAEYILHCDQTEDLKSELCQLLQRVLLPTELFRIQFKELAAPYVGPGTKSFSSRFSMSKSSNNDEYLRIVQSITYMEPTFPLDKILDIQHFLPLFLDILPFIKSMRLLKLPPLTDSDPLALIHELPLNLRFLNAIEISSPIQSNLDDFINTINSNHKNSVFSSLSFKSAHLDDKQLMSIANSIRNGPITSIGFHNAINSIPSLYKSFLIPEITQNITILNLDGTTNLQLSELFSKTSNIQFISLANCDIDIGTTFYELSEASMQELTILNLSGNNFTTIPTDKEIALPESFQKLILNNIQWADNSLSELFSFLFSHFPQGLSLDFSNATASTDEFMNLFKFFDNTPYNSLIGLSWCNNPIHIDLLHFLQRNQQIHRLELDGCFDSNCAEIVAELCSFIEISTSLQYLSIIGTKTNHLGSQVVNIIQKCIGHKTIEVLNLSNSYGGDDALQYILPLLKGHGKVKIVDFEGLRCQNVDSFKQLLNDISKLHDRPQVSFPLKDIQKLLKKEQITEKEAAHLKDLFRTKYNDDGTINDVELKIQPATIELLNPPHIIYKYYKEPSFPDYVTDDFLTQLQNELKYDPTQNLKPAPIEISSIHMETVDGSGKDRNLSIDGEQQHFTSDSIHDEGKLSDSIHNEGRLSASYDESPLNNEKEDSVQQGQLLLSEQSNDDQNLNSALHEEEEAEAEEITIEGEFTLNTQDTSPPPKEQQKHSAIKHPAPAIEEEESDDSSSGNHLSFYSNKSASNKSSHHSTINSKQESSMSQKKKSHSKLSKGSSDLPKHFLLSEDVEEEDMLTKTNQPFVVPQGKGIIPIPQKRTYITSDVSYQSTKSRCTESDASDISKSSKRSTRSKKSTSSGSRKSQTSSNGLAVLKDDNSSSSNRRKKNIDATSSSSKRSGTSSISSSKSKRQRNKDVDFADDQYSPQTPKARKNMFDMSDTTSTMSSSPASRKAKHSVNNDYLYANSRSSGNRSPKGFSPTSPNGSPKRAPPVLVELGEYDWKFSINFNMEHTSNQYNEINEKYSLEHLFTSLSEEKSICAVKSPPRKI